jgi:hypothetical protein
MNPSSEPRKTASLSESLDRQLSMYALAAEAAGVGRSANLRALSATAAGVGILALAQPAEAKIVYTPTYQVVSHYHAADIDLNHDGINDFVISTYYAAGSGSTVGIRAYQVPKFTGANKVMGKGKYAYAFRAGVEIGPKKQFKSADSRMASYILTGGASKTYFRGLWANDGKGVKNRYLGFRFVLKGKVHYGWARVTIKFHGTKFNRPTGFLTGYAYETIPGKAILAGATNGPDDAEPSAALSSHTPEPTTLGALALGAPGLSIWRRRESAAAALAAN